MATCRNDSRRPGTALNPQVYANVMYLISGINRILLSVAILNGGGINSLKS